MIIDKSVVYRKTKKGYFFYFTCLTLINILVIPPLPIRHPADRPNKMLTNTNKPWAADLREFTVYEHWYTT